MKIGKKTPSPIPNEPKNLTHNLPRCVNNFQNYIAAGKLRPLDGRPAVKRLHHGFSTSQETRSLAVAKRPCDCYASQF